MPPCPTCFGDITVLRAPLPAVQGVTGVMGVAMFDFARTDLTVLGFLRECLTKKHIDVQRKDYGRGKTHQ